MSNLTNDFSMFFTSIHCSALLLGSAVYLSYRMLSSFVRRVQTSKRLPETQPKSTDIAASCEAFNAQEGFVEEEVAGGQVEGSSGQEEATSCIPLPSRVNHWSLRKDVGVFLVGVVFVLFDVGFYATFVDEAESLCTHEMGSSTPLLEWPSSPFVTKAAAGGLALSRPAVPTARNSAAPHVSEQNSAAWTLPSVSAQIKWARIIHETFQLHCKAVTADLHRARRTKGVGLQATTAAEPALAALTALKALQVPFQETLAALVSGIEVLKSNSMAGQELQVLLGALGALRTCGLQALQEGRLVALALPPRADLVSKAKKCQPRMLEGFEDLVVKQAMVATDASSIFALGLYFSDIGLAAAEGQEEALFFSVDPLSLTRDGLSQSRWALDEQGWHAPAELVKAEALLQTGELATADPDRSAQGAVRALRLYLHAKQLAIKQHDGASEWRYRAAAELAKSHERQKLSAHALARLGYLFSYRGRHAEALQVVQEALEYGEEPLAQFLHVSLRRSLGELRSANDLQAAERMLSKVAGKLPSKGLENERAAALADLQWWRLSSTQGLRMCLQAGDAARFMICALGNLIFEATEIASK